MRVVLAAFGGFAGLHIRKDGHGVVTRWYRRGDSREVLPLDPDDLELLIKARAVSARSIIIYLVLAAAAWVGTILLLGAGMVLLGIVAGVAGLTLTMLDLLSVFGWAMSSYRGSSVVLDPSVVGELLAAVETERENLGKRPPLKGGEARLWALAQQLSSAEPAGWALKDEDGAEQETGSPESQ
jgi:hypothetical protein